jgi:hypothetical protein
MHLVKWFRKNNTKIMAVVVIVLMIGFVGGSALTGLLRGSGGARDTIAYFGQKQKITPYDIAMARQELEMLQAMRAEQVLQSQDLRGIFLSELLVSQRRTTPAVLNYVMQLIQRNQYRVSPTQLKDLYQQRTVVPAFYWLLLREEARSAGIRLSAEEVGGLLSQVVPRLFEGQTYPAVMQFIVRRYRVSEEEVLRTFGELLAVLQYAQTVCASESITDAQLRHLAARANETLDVEFVQLEARSFVDKDQTPSDEELAAHFDKYKGYFAGEVTEANPFAFGYKLPARVQLEYIAVKLADVATIVKMPTDEETEQYYRDNRQERFTEEVQVDPNDPNSVEQRVKPYVEVYDTIVTQLKQQRVNTKAEQILQEAKNQADAGLEAVIVAEQEPTAEQLKAQAGDYQKIAQELGDKYGIALYNGRTGLLSARDVQTDEILGRLGVPGYGPSPIRLSQVLFSVRPLEEDAIPLMFAQPPRLYASIGPAQDPMATMAPDFGDGVVALMRVTQARKAAEPENPGVTFSTRALSLGETSDDEETTFSVREKVLEDWRKLAAWDTTKSRAQEFVDLASKDGWDRAVAAFNERYGEQAKADPNDPNVFTVQQEIGLQRISSDQLQVLAARTTGSPVAEDILNEAKAERQFIDRLYALVPPDAETPAKLPDILEFKPTQSVYCLKDVSVQRLTQQQYQAMKGMLLRQEEYRQSQSLAAVHFNPANILKRTRFEPVTEAQEQPADQDQQEAEETT